MQHFRTYLSFLLLGAMAFLISPQELLHEFSHHEDTKDVLCSDVCKDHISSHHQHCEALQLTTPPLYHKVNTFSFAVAAVQCASAIEVVSGYYSTSSAFLFFRGPPSVI